MQIRSRTIRDAEESNEGDKIKPYIVGI